MLTGNGLADADHRGAFMNSIFPGGEFVDRGDPESDGEHGGARSTPFTSVPCFFSFPGVSATSVSPTASDESEEIVFL